MRDQVLNPYKTTDKVAGKEREREFQLNAKVFCERSQFLIKEF
jgi:hypothetical protein